MQGAAGQRRVGGITPLFGEKDVRDEDRIGRRQAARLRGQGRRQGSGENRRRQPERTCPAYRDDSTRKEILAFTR